MGAGSKMLAGCGCLALAGAAVLIGALALGTWWLRDQAIDVTDGLEALVVRNHEIQTWERRVGALPYTPPEGGVVPEARLKVFLDVRRQVHQVYTPYAAELEGLREQVEGRAPAPSTTELLDVGARAARMFAELRLAQLKALSEGGMSEAEYGAIRNAVYVAVGVARAESRMGRLPAEAVSDATGRLRDTLRAALERARAEGLPGSERVSDEDVERLDQALSRAGTEGGQALAAPAENVALVRKHEEELERYAMHGLAVLGL